MVVKRFLDNQKGRSRKTPPETKRSEKGSEYIKGINLKICRRAKKYGAIRKRFSGECPDPLGFELTLLSEFKRVVWRVLDCAAKRHTCIKTSTRP